MVQPLRPKPKSNSWPGKTNAQPVQAGNCAYLKVVNVTPTSAFLQWIAGQDLLVPVSQQLTAMKLGKSYVVYLYSDPQQRIIGSSKLYRFLDERAKNMAVGEPVDLLIVGESELGYKAVVNGSHLGLLYKNEVFQPLQAGDITQGYIKEIRADRKIDLSLQRQNKSSRVELSDRILAFLKANDGTATLTDYSPPRGNISTVWCQQRQLQKSSGGIV